MSAAEPPSLRPAGFGDAFRAAFATWWKTLPIAGLAALVVLAPAYALAFTIAAAVAPEALADTFFSNGEVDLDPDQAAVAGSVALLTAAITGIASVVAFAVSFKAVVAGYAGARRSFGATLSHGLARGGSAFWVAVLYGVVILGIAVAAAAAIGVASAAGAIAALLVGILAIVAALVVLVWLGVSWSVALAAVLSDDERGTRALRRSAQLVSGRWWATFGVLLVAWVAILAGSFVLALILTIPFAAAGSDVTRLAANNVAGVLTGALTTPLWASFVAVLYYDFRFRKERLSLDDAARSVGAERDPGENPLAPLAPEPALGNEHPPPAYPPPAGDPPPHAPPEERSPQQP